MWNFKYLVCIYVYECTYMCVCVCVCVLIDTKNKLMVTRGMGWWVEEMGGLFLFFGLLSLNNFENKNKHKDAQAHNHMHQSLTWLSVP